MHRQVLQYIGASINSNSKWNIESILYALYCILDIADDIKPIDQRITSNQSSGFQSAKCIIKGKETNSNNKSSNNSNNHFWRNVICNITAAIISTCRNNLIILTKEGIGSNKLIVKRLFDIWNRVSESTLLNLGINLCLYPHYFIFVE